MRDERRLSHLYQLWGEAPGDEDPVGRGEQAVAHHRAEDERAQLLPLLAEVVWVDLSEEDGQDHGQNRHQVHLPPVLQRQGGLALFTGPHTHTREQQQNQSMWKVEVRMCVSMAQKTF